LFTKLKRAAARLSAKKFVYTNFCLTVQRHFFYSQDCVFHTSRKENCKAIV